MDVNKSKRRMRTACDRCHHGKLRCSAGKPCSNCHISSNECKYSLSDPLGRPKGTGGQRKNQQQSEARPETTPLGHTAAESWTDDEIMKIILQSEDPWPEFLQSIPAMPSLDFTHHAEPSMASSSIRPELHRADSAIGYFDPSLVPTSSFTPGTAQDLDHSLLVASAFNGNARHSLSSQPGDSTYHGSQTNSTMSTPSLGGPEHFPPAHLTTRLSSGGSPSPMPKPCFTPQNNNNIVTACPCLTNLFNFTRQMGNAAPQSVSVDVLLRTTKQAMSTLTQAIECGTCSNHPSEELLVLAAMTLRRVLRVFQAFSVDRSSGTAAAHSDVVMSWAIKDFCLEEADASLVSDVLALQYLRRLISSASVLGSWRGMGVESVDPVFRVPESEEMGAALRNVREALSSLSQATTHLEGCLRFREGGDSAS